MSTLAVTSREPFLPPADPRVTLRAPAIQTPGPGAAERAEPTSFAESLAVRTATPPEREDDPRVIAEKLVSSVFIRPILAQLRETSQAAGPFAPGTAERRFGPLLDERIADDIVSGANLPLVERIESDLRERQERLAGAGADERPGSVAASTDRSIAQSIDRSIDRSIETASTEESR